MWGKAPERLWCSAQTTSRPSGTVGFALGAPMEFQFLAWHEAESAAAAAEALLRFDPSDPIALATVASLRRRADLLLGEILRPMKSPTTEHGLRREAVAKAG